VWWKRAGVLQGGGVCSGRQIGPNFSFPDFARKSFGGMPCGPIWVMRPFKGECGRFFGSRHYSPCCCQISKKKRKKVDFTRENFSQKNRKKKFKKNSKKYLIE